MSSSMQTMSMDDCLHAEFLQHVIEWGRAQAVYAHQKMHVSACSTGIALTSTADALRRCNVVYTLQGHGLELSRR